MMTKKDIPEVGRLYYDKELDRNYWVVRICNHSFTGEEMVLFEAQDDPTDVWVRPLIGWYDDFEPFV